jgi:protein-tyrosine phosphatase
MSLRNPAIRRKAQRHSTTVEILYSDKAIFDFERIPILLASVVNDVKCIPDDVTNTSETRLEMRHYNLENYELQHCVNLLLLEGFKLSLDQSLNNTEKCILFTYDAKYDTKDIDTPVHEILDGLYLGDYSSSLDKHLIKNEIKCVISMVGRNPDVRNYVSYTEEEEHKTKLTDIERIYYDIDDVETVDISKYFTEIHEKIDQQLHQKKNVLIHCIAGVSRSTTIVISYIMKTKKMSFKDAFLFVESKRYVANPNIGFRKQLLRYQNELLSYNSNIVA